MHYLYLFVLYWLHCSLRSDLSLVHVVLISVVTDSNAKRRSLPEISCIPSKMPLVNFSDVNDEGVRGEAEVPSWPQLRENILWSLLYNNLCFRTLVQQCFSSQFTFKGNNLLRFFLDHLSRAGQEYWMSQNESVHDWLPIAKMHKCKNPDRAWSNLAS